MGLGNPLIAVVTKETRLQGLKARWNTVKQAAFRLAQAIDHEQELRRARRLETGAAADDADLLMEDASAAAALADHVEYEEEDQQYQLAVQRLLREIDWGYPIRTVDRTYLPTFDFQRCLAVVVIGPDGLVANTAKYVGNLPIIGVNPDPQRFDGVLLPFDVGAARFALRAALDRKAKIRDVTLAEVQTNDGQRMLAFNDFYVGAASHVSARYMLECPQGREPQSSSGVLVSTGAGSTGWLSSLFNMASGLASFFGGAGGRPVQMEWGDRRLVWAVREPFASRHSGARLVAGFLEEADELVIGSQMPQHGVIFSDGVESDFIEFNSGVIARFSMARLAARLVVPR